MERGRESHIGEKEARRNPNELRLRCAQREQKKGESAPARTLSHTDISLSFHTSILHSSHHLFLSLLSCGRVDGGRGACRRGVASATMSLGYTQRVGGKEKGKGELRRRNEKGRECSEGKRRGYG